MRARDAHAAGTVATMRAAVLRTFGEPLRIEQVPIPSPAEHEVLVRVRAAGICATDLKLAAGRTAPPPSLPHIPGHEGAGDVVRDSGHLRAGQRVACHILDACGVCGECRRGFPVFCADATRMGLDRDGAMAEYVVVPRALALPFPDAMPYAHAAVAMDSITTPWHALHGVGAVRAGERVLIAGIGGLGINAVQIAVAAGARVAAVDVDASRLEQARLVGAELAVAPESIERVRAWADGAGVDVAVELSGRREGFDAAATAVRAGGRLVCCGYAPGVEYGMDSARLVLDNIQVLGSRNVTVAESVASLAAVADGDVTPQIADTYALEDVNDALERLRAGRAGGRLVIEP
ncbi:alcohol dehydrogenase catalytic domain-containing protein [Conexibacter sp. CPCC 206217]|uniref:alcohol dehydrogenase catalytic domain-containing protein n=1 Tax=Conexibacter sp. CPCC 206217 TaxID=3064574 RepID=UPI0027276E1A|nr:alcohol dehydrogenase catalytic domain-containing protein [Conexibacter sp. CPCC 206217]MDO8210129.1 alcohol dehydrogenase catalytic domain-containing protein [Conexibacter sp. CPCC 206217]